MGGAQLGEPTTPPMIPSADRLRASLSAPALTALTSAEVVAGRERRFEVPAALASLLPGGGPLRGSTVGIGTGPVPGQSTLALAMISTASCAGRWAAMVGMAALAPVAAAQLGVALDHLVAVPRPDRQWAVVTAALLESMDVVVVQPPGRVRPVDARHLVARARERGALLVVLGGGWPAGVDLRLTVTRSVWVGLDQGHGHLRIRLAHVAVTGRRARPAPEAMSRARPAPEAMGTTSGCGGDQWLWLPGPDGGITLPSSAEIAALTGRLSAEPSTDQGAVALPVGVADTLTG